MKLNIKSALIGGVALTQAIAIFALVKSILDINILPTQHVIMIVIGAIFLFASSLFLQTRTNWIQYIGFFLAIAVSVGCVIASTTIIKANSTIKEIVTPDNYVDKVVVVVRTDSNVNSLDDITTEIVGMQYTQQSELMLAAEGKLLLENNKEFNTKTYNTIIEQVLALFNEEVDVIIYNNAYGDLFLEQMPDFNQKTKIVHTIDMTKDDIKKYKDVIDLSIKEDYIEPTPPIIEETEPTEPEETIPEISEPQNEEVFAVYMSGIDVYGSITTNSRSDVNIIGVVNPKENKILLITTPRDTFVRIPGVSGDKKDKLTHAGIYGIEASINTLSELYNVDIDYYLRVNFTSFETIVDALGGISVYSAYDFTTADGYHYNKGYNDLNGKAALRFVRERYSFAAGDHQRGKNQQEAIKAIIKKACSPAILISANEILDSVRENIDMNIPEELIQDLIKKQLSDGKEWEFITMAATGTGSQDEPYSMPGFTAYVMIPNEASIEEIRQAIREMYE